MLRPGGYLALIREGFMKKKNLKKLVLAKETLRGLTTQDLRVAGGTATYGVTCGCNSWQWIRTTTTGLCGIP